MNILLLNVMIAIMTSSFAKVQQVSEESAPGKATVDKQVGFQLAQRLCIVYFLSPHVRVSVIRVSVYQNDTMSHVSMHTCGFVHSSFQFGVLATKKGPADTEGISMPVPPASMLECNFPTATTEELLSQQLLCCAHTPPLVHSCKSALHPPGRARVVLWP